MSIVITAARAQAWILNLINPLLALLCDRIYCPFPIKDILTSYGKNTDEFYDDLVNVQQLESIGSSDLKSATEVFDQAVAKHIASIRVLTKMLEEGKPEYSLRALVEYTDSIKEYRDENIWSSKRVSFDGPKWERVWKYFIERLLKSEEIDSHNLLAVEVEDRRALSEIRLYSSDSEHKQKQLELCGNFLKDIGPQVAAIEATKKELGAQKKIYMEALKVIRFELANKYGLTIR